jgi:hypothetical protein
LNDPTSLTKQQKYVFDKSKKDLPQELQDQWTQLLADNSPGIQKKRNQFINSLVPKSVTYADFVAPKAVNSLVRFFSKEDKVSRTRMASGRTRTQLIGDLGVHGRELFKEGLDCKDIWQDPKDGLYYMRTSTFTRFQSQSEVEQVQREQSATNAGWIALQGAMTTDMLDWKDWAEGKGNGSASSGSAGCLSTQKDDAETVMKLLQEAFDATTRLTLAVRRVSIELMQKAGESMASMRARGVALCKALVEPSEEMEMLLAKTVAEVNPDTVRSVLHKTTQHFTPLQQFYEELVAIYKVHFGKKPKQISS